MAQILLFTKTTGYRHDSISDGVVLVTDEAAKHGIDVTHTEEGADFTSENLARYEAVVWLQVSGDVLDDSARSALQTYLMAGGGFAGIHGASDAERGWPLYEQIVGARFLHHPKNGAQTASLHVEDNDHPSTVALGDPWVWTEEWYTFEKNPRSRVQVLLTVEEATYDPEAERMGDDHPISWAGVIGQGRTWYTALGHHAEAYADASFRAHVWGGITSVLRDGGETPIE